MVTDQEKTENSKKLLEAMEDIKAVFKKHGVGGFCTLHLPGCSEYFIEVSPPYSCAKMDDEAGRVDIYAHSKHYNSEEEKMKKLNDTVNMFVHLKMVATMLADNFGYVMDSINRQIGFVEVGQIIHENADPKV